MKKTIEFLKDIFWDIIASSFWAVALIMIIIPNKLAPGGCTAISIILNFITGFNLGFLTIVANVVLLLFAWKTVGLKFVLNTVRTVFVFGILVDYVFANIPTYTNDTLLAAIFAGVLNGIGSAIAFNKGSSGGGIDIIIKVVKIKKPHIAVGKITILTNGLLMIMVAYLYGTFEAVLYGLVETFAYGQMVDILLKGVSGGYHVTIMSKKSADICEEIIKNLQRSATILDGVGAYSKENVPVILCYVTKQELAKLTKIVAKVDKEAFYIVEEVSQISGKRFENNSGGF